MATAGLVGPITDWLPCAAAVRCSPALTATGHLLLPRTKACATVSDRRRPEVYMHHRPPRGRYRGRRRAPTPPRGRYAAVITTAVVGAGVVALGTSTTLPDGGLDVTAAESSIYDGPGDPADRTQGNRASRGDSRVPLSSSDQAAPKIWLLPLPNYT